MSRNIRVLMVDDSEDDARLVQRALARAGFKPALTRVETRPQMLEALEDSGWDTVIVDYHLSQFSGLEALDTLRSHGCDLPVIAVSGSIGEEQAVDILKAGAADFIMKTNLARLAPAVERELREAETRRQNRAALQALQESEEKFSKVFQTTPDSITLTCLAGGVYLDGNPGFTNFFGYTREEAIGKSALGLNTWVNPAERPRMVELLQKEGKLSGFEAAFRAKDGTIKTGSLSGSLIDVGGEPCVVLINRDISDRVQRERELEAIVAVSRALRDTNSRAEMLPVILDQLAALMQLDGSAIGFYNSATGETHIELGQGAWSGMTGVRIPAGEGITSQVIATNRPYVNHDIKTDVQMYRADLHVSLRVAACVPLIIQNLTIGVLWVGRDAPPDEVEQPSAKLNIITKPELNVLQAIAEIAASAIHRTTLHEQTQTQLQHLLSISAIDRAISSSLDIHLTLNIFLKEIRSLLGADAAAVLLFNPSLRTLDYAAGIGFRSTAIQRDCLRLGQGFAGKAAFERTTMVVVDLAERIDDFEGQWGTTEEAVASYIAAPLISKGQVVGVLEIFQRTPFDPGQDWLELLDMLATQAAIAIDNATLFESLQRANTNLIQAYDATIEGWSRALDLRDEETEGHTERVTEMVLRLARRIGTRDQDLVHIRRGCLLHDIGKMAIPDSILLKPGPLDDMEWGIMRKHPDYAMQMLSPIAYLRPALDIPYYHHERWDGSGYPGKLKAEAIPLVARIFAVVDVWDALRSNRPYRRAWSDADALAHIRKGAGSHFDPQVVEAFLQEINSGEEMKPPD